MLSQKLLDALNDQFNYELLSAHYYIAMAAYCADQDLDGFANFFMVQAEEERFHAMKFYNYINEVDGRANLEGISTPKNDFESITDVFQNALSHENSVTKRIYNLMDIAQDEREHATISFLRWFVDEQIEEEASMKTIIKKLERLGNDNHGLFVLDQELGQRVFTPPTN
ncbi:ferritin [Gottschalkia acidurici 9a]|uniref:Ferritin n=1 Tax=Gottschalkia acidurici (strain ATCC 7906 / DSM 604 / BCRC 14475 / CIP 104303 / KCTC 5404 / NCIMB 10678 / 9a) TaxID=1128398 RepID=K0B3Q1_GOTA9|nr:ferritin [Gottschalkia acidurici]AFS79226.1 ferritin [Gottschalkia acidurici 9a]